MVFFQLQCEGQINFATPYNELREPNITPQYCREYNACETIQN